MTPEQEAREWFASVGWLDHSPARQHVNVLLATLADKEAEVERLRRGLEHYAEKLHWSLVPDDRPESLNKPYYPEWTYDGGEDEPWRIARAALTEAAPA